jgi:hypothetical protein
MKECNPGSCHVKGSVCVVISIWVRHIVAGKILVN